MTSTVKSSRQHVSFAFWLALFLCAHALVNPVLGRECSTGSKKNVRRLADVFLRQFCVT